MLRKSWLGLLLSVAVLGAAHWGCSVNPATGKRQLNALSPAQEASLGNEAAPQFLTTYGGDIPSSEIRQYVSELGRRLAQVGERPALPWEFHVVDSAVLNAFALPGGKVFVSRGLLAKLENEAQLAGVLGHEVGHVTAQHVGQQMTRGLLLQGVAIGLGVAASHSDEDWMKALGVGVSVGGTVYLLKFSRDQESEADVLGVRYMAKLGYNPVGQLQMMRVLEQAAAGHAAGMPEFLSTHPLPKTRIRHLEKHIRAQYPDYEDPAAYQFRFAEYKQTVLDTLGKLGPPKHTGEGSAAVGASQTPVCLTCGLLIAGK